MGVHTGVHTGIEHRHAQHSGCRWKALVGVVLKECRLAYTDPSDMPSAIPMGLYSLDVAAGVGDSKLTAEQCRAFLKYHPNYEFKFGSRGMIVGIDVVCGLWS